MPIAWMPIYWADYLADTTHLSTEQHGAYLLLIATYWRRQKPLPDDNRFLANVTKLSPKKWLTVRRALEVFFEISDGAWVHKRIEKEILRVCERSESARVSASHRHYGKDANHNHNHKEKDKNAREPEARNGGAQRTRAQTNFARQEVNYGYTEAEDPNARRLTFEEQRSYERAFRVPPRTTGKPEGEWAGLGEP